MRNPPHKLTRPMWLWVEAGDNGYLAFIQGHPGGIPIDVAFLDGDFAFSLTWEFFEPHDTPEETITRERLFVFSADIAESHWCPQNWML